MSFSASAFCLASTALALASADVSGNVLPAAAAGAPAAAAGGAGGGGGGSAGGASESHRRRLDRRPSAGGDPAPSLGRFSAEPAMDDLVRSTEKRRFSAR